MTPKVAFSAVCSLQRRYVCAHGGGVTVGRVKFGDASAQVLVPCIDLDAMIGFFTVTLGFRVDRISPADNPREADLSGYGVGVLLRCEGDPSVTVLRLASDRVDEATFIVGPDEGVVVELVPAVRPLVVPPIDQSLVISRLADSPTFGVGRAGMGYRDLIPGRQGGRFIASHIRIDGGGEVPDYAHFHRIRFQMIYCYRGWVRVVYEDQGEPFVLLAGDCVLQPPEIRHRVLESSPGLEVIEVGCPAEHDTFADHQVVLPSGVLDPERHFGGQRFVHHVAEEVGWEPWRLPGFDCRDTGIGAATSGLAGARAVRFTGNKQSTAPFAHDSEFMFVFVQDGAMSLDIAGTQHTLAAGDSVVIPAGEPHVLTSAAPDTQLLEVTLPASIS